MNIRHSIPCAALSLCLLTAALPGCGSQSPAQSAAPTAAPTAQAAAEPTAAPAPEVLNDYTNTQALLEKFPVVNPTPVNSELEQAIQNRLLTGFENWNRGYDTWAAWGDILYTPDSLYNVHSVHLTLPEYQMAMNLSLRSTDMQMGSFNNMLICDDWTAVRYEITSTDRETGASAAGTVMEFVQFRDYGEELGVRVVEGWAGTKGSDYEAMTALQTEEERAAQQAAAEALLNTVVPDTADLTQKYPVLHPTSFDEETGALIRDAILQDFDHWNQGYDAWAEWADRFYAAGYTSTSDGGVQTLEEYKAAVQQESAETQTTRISFNNLLISGDWAAIYYNVIHTDLATGARTTGNVMQFLHLSVQDGQVQVLESWTE